MTDHEPRSFADAAAIRRVGEGLVARTLPRVEWTHEAHLAACTWIVRERPDLVPERHLPAIISRYNEAVGVRNSDTEGYHETITRVFVAAVRAHEAETGYALELCASVNALLRSDRGRRDWPLRFYSPERLFSVEARRTFVAPDRNADTPTSGRR